MQVFFSNMSVEVAFVSDYNDDGVIFLVSCYGRVQIMFRHLNAQCHLCFDASRWRLSAALRQFSAAEKQLTAVDW